MRVLVSGCDIREWRYRPRPRISSTRLRRNPDRMAASEEYCCTYTTALCSARYRQATESVYCVDCERAERAMRSRIPILVRFGHVQVLKETNV